MQAENSETGKEALSEAGLSEPERWIEEHGDYLFRCALLRIRDPNLAEDVVQETLLAALESRNRFEGASTERSWLVGILKHKVIDHFRRISREFPVENVEPFGEEFAETFDEKDHWKSDTTGPCEWAADPALLVERKEFWDVLTRCLSRLPGRMANAFSLREIDETDSRMICDTLNISASNLWVLLHRARMQLRACLETHFFGEKMARSKR